MRPVLPLLLALALFGAGCQTEPAPRPPVSTPEATPIVQGQETKDTTVVAAANKIDKVVEKDAPQVVAPVKEQTDKIREAVAANPAEDIKKLAAKFEEAISLLRNQLEEADKQNQKLQATIENLRNAEQKAQARELRYFAFAALALAGLLAWAKQFQFAAAAVLSGLLAFGLAQLVSQPWFMPACTVAVVLILGGVGWAAVHAYRKKELAAKVEKEAAKLKDTLARVVPAVDGALDEVGEAGKKLFHNKLREFMTGAQGAIAKATIHEIRAENAKTSS